MVRAKMRVQSIEKFYKGAETVKLWCVTGGTPEDNAFAKATPQGDARLVIENETLHGFFQPGDEFYVDFTKAE